MRIVAIRGPAAPVVGTARPPRLALAFSWGALTLACGARTGLGEQAPGDIAGNVSSDRPVALSAGDDHTCALLSSGAVKCWGSNSYGQLGTGSTRNSTTPALVAGLQDVISISAGVVLTCAVLVDQSATCWGSNYVGELGVGSTTGPSTSCFMSRACSRTPVPVAGLGGVVAVSAGASFACALLLDQTVECWGDDISGQLGSIPPTMFPEPVRPTAAPVPGLQHVTAVAAGRVTGSAAISDGTLESWGDDAFGQIGNPANAPPTLARATDISSGFVATPLVVVPGLTGVTAVVQAEASACALMSNGTVACWGDNAFGELGNGTTTSSTSPVPVLNLSGVTAISARGYHVCALVSDGGVMCWGLGSRGQLGIGAYRWPAAGRFLTTPARVVGLSDVTAVAAGVFHTCALRPKGDVLCWGANESGQLGDGTTNGSPTPVAVVW